MHRLELRDVRLRANAGEATDPVVVCQLAESVEDVLEKWSDEGVLYLQDLEDPLDDLRELRKELESEREDNARLVEERDALAKERDELKEKLREAEAERDRVLAVLSTVRSAVATLHGNHSRESATVSNSGRRRGKGSKSAVRAKA